MNYQGSVLGATTVATGVAILPNTGGSTLLTIAGIAAVVTGFTVIAIQLGVNLYTRRSK